ncbi:2Fe-2S iron-sulfur cluster-binding protein [Nisaea sp.]|uniref:2Fe-2S iron-sulfur cluster-binding protein n=1 Tax=Nisaea sp. TaxID=2024842 RepID=UPI003B52F489
MQEIKVTWIEADGTRKTAAVEVGQVLMEAAVENDVEGIIGSCGGNLACATCHVLVESSPAPLPDMEPDEDDMLDMADPERRPASRLSCQLRATPDLDGIVLRVP